MFSFKIDISQELKLGLAIKKSSSKTSWEMHVTIPRILKCLSEPNIFLFDGNSSFGLYHSTINLKTAKHYL